MRPLFPKVVLFFVFLSCSECDNPNKTEKVEKSSAITVKAEKENLKANRELQDAWSSFAKAVISNDLQTIKRLSTDCVLCTDCLINSPKEDSLFNAYQDNHPNEWYDQFLNNRYISIQTFIEEDKLTIFDENTLSRLLDESKIIFFNNNHNRKLYAKECIIKSSEPDSANLEEVFITVVDPSEKAEGMQKAFAFIKTKSGYKFCGYSTIP